MEFLAIFAVLLILGGVLSAQHAIIKSVVDWIHPKQGRTGYISAEILARRNIQRRRTFDRVCLALLALFVVGSMLQVGFWLMDNL